MKVGLFLMSKVSYCIDNDSIECWQVIIKEMLDVFVSRGQDL